MGMKMIRVENITKSYRTDDGQNTSLQVLRGISLEIQKGEIIAVVGAVVLLGVVNLVQRGRVR